VLDLKFACGGTYVGANFRFIKHTRNIDFLVS
jgi:hypothetical protein